MKIGILTHHYVCNYGAFLQAYCLLKAIARLYPEAEVSVIDYINLKHKLINAAGLFRFHPKRDSLASWKQKISLNKTFKQAGSRYLHLTKRVLNPAGIRKLGLDVMVVGSDEVWNYVDKRSFHPVKFGVGLSGADNKPRLVAYAPSVGLATDFSNMPAQLVQGIKGFYALSARDENTQNLLLTVTGKRGAQVLDPVFLERLPTANTRRVYELTREPYVLFYHFGGEINKELIDAVHGKGCRLIGAGEYHKGFDAVSANLTPFEMATLFARARYVLTGTFHGVVLSAVHGAPFSVAPNNPTRVQKITSLLNDLGLEDRLVLPENFSAQAELGRALDYKKTNALIKQKRAASMEYLTNALGNP